MHYLCFMNANNEIADQLKLENQACFPLYALAREVVNAYRPLLEDLGLTYPQYLVLMVLWERGPQTVNQLGIKLHLDSGTLTPLLKRLEAKVVLNRNRSSQDERVVEVSLTPEGIALQKSAAKIPAQLIDALKIDEGDLHQLRQISCKILQKIQ